MSKNTERTQSLECEPLAPALLLSLHRIVKTFLDREQERHLLRVERQEDTPADIWLDLVKVENWLNTSATRSITPTPSSPTPPYSSIAEELKRRFPWLGTGEDAGSGADIIQSLTDWYDELQ